MNQTTIAGNLGADPEVRFTAKGTKVTTLRVAAKARKGGVDETIWWKVSVWGDQFDKMITFLKKGSSVIVTGDLNKPEIFTDREGKPQVSMSLNAYHVGFSPFGKSDGAKKEEQQSSVEPAFAGASSGSFTQSSSSSAFSDDDIPF